MPKLSRLMTDEERAVCSRVKQFREQIKWPQSAFAFEIGITRDQLASIEYARTPLKYSIGALMCRLFNISESWLASGRGPVTPFGDTGPSPQRVPPSILFTDVYKSAMKSHADLWADVIVPTKSKAERERKHVPVPDPSLHLVKGVLEAFSDLKPSSPETSEEFCDQVIRAASTIGLRMRTSALATRVRAKPPDVSKRTVASAKAILRAEERIAGLEAQLEEAKAELRRLLSGVE